jgi:pyruvate dehydrogenase E2 component (dihydrolipoamide acetyltransferase)
MPVLIAMPKLGMTMQEGTVVEWRVPVGGSVARGQIVLSIETEKAEVEIEAPAAGVLRHVYVQPGETVACGTPLAALTETSAEPFDAEAFRRQVGGAGMPAPRPESQAQPARAAAPPREPSAAGRAAEQLPQAPITPAARRVARDLAVDVRQVRGTGPGGRITQEDVEAHAAALASRRRVAEGVALEVTVTGTGPTLLLLPGFGADVSAFARQAPALAERCRVLAVNPRGVGLSDAPDADVYDVQTAAADAAAVADGDLHVIGASLGAAIAIEMALSWPARVRSLTLITPFVRAGARLRTVVETWCRIAAESSAETLARFLVPWLFSERLLADDVRRERAVRALVQTVPRVLPATLGRAARGLLAWSGTRDGDLGRIGAPTLVLTAADDLLTPDGDTIAAAMANARCVRIDGAGHAVGLEAPDAVNEAIGAHLARVEGFR